MKLTSSAFGQGETIPKKYTCDLSAQSGGNIHPPLSITDIPAGTRSLALVVDDPDAPMGLWVHWVLWNLSQKTTEIKEGEVPKEAEEGTTSAEKKGYHGPCPPDGEHRYFFKLYALDASLDLPPDADKEALEEAMVGHIVERAELMGVYER